MPKKYEEVQAEAVRRALETIDKGFSVRNAQNGKIKAIQDLFQESFDVSDPKGTRKLNSQRLQQALWRTTNRTKPLDFILNGNDKDGIPVDPNQERIVTAGVSTVMDKGGYASAFRDKQGLAFNFLLYGDAFLQIGTNDKRKSDVPIKFRVVPNDAIYVDNYATAIRATAAGSSATKLVIIYTYSKENFDGSWPGYEEVQGSLPRNNAEKSILKTTEQNIRNEDKVEVGYSFDLTESGDIKPTYLIFAGNAGTALECKVGEDYPFMKDGEPYIPVMQFICMPSSEGFYNEGIGSMLYKLAMVSRELLNMEVNHVYDGTYPIVHVNIPKGKVAQYFNRLKSAHEMRAQGKKGYVAMEYDPNSPNSERASAETLVTQNLFNEWQAVWDRLDREIRRLGINIDELDTKVTTTATEINALEENSNAFVKQMMEQNSSESKFAVDATMEIIAEFVTKNNKVPLQVKTNIQLDSGKSVRAPQLTLGMVAEELKQNSYWCEINSRSGAIPSNSMLRAQYQSVLARAMPGSPAWMRANKALSQIDGFDAAEEDYMVAAPQAPAQEPGQGQAPMDPGTATDRMSISPRAKQQVPVFK